MNILEAVEPALVQKSQQEWKGIFSLFSGWSNCSDAYSFGVKDKFLLEAELGRWVGRIRLRPDGLYEGEWARWRNPHCDSRPEEIFAFKPESSLRQLLDILERWIEVRRNPSTWRGGMTPEKEELLLLGKSR